MALAMVKITGAGYWQLLELGKGNFTHWSKHREVLEVAEGNINQLLELIK